MNCNCVPKEPALEEAARHPHDKIIRAWLDGEVIQAKHLGGWQDVGTVAERSSVPPFGKNITYRIKPKTVTVTFKYRRYIARGSYTGHLSVKIFHYDDSGRVNGLVKWIDNDWVTETYEVEVES